MAARKKPRLSREERADIRGKRINPTPLAVFAGLEPEVDRRSLWLLFEEAARPWQHCDIMLGGGPARGIRWSEAAPGTADDPRCGFRRLGWELRGAEPPARDGDPRECIEALAEQCERRLRGSAAEARAPARAARAALRLSCGRGRGAHVEMRPLLLAQAFSLGIWGLCVREAAAACAFPAAQRRQLCELLGFRAAAVLHFEAWDRVILALLPRLLPAESARLLPRNRCWPGAPCGCHGGRCWCDLPCGCRDPRVPSSLDAELWREVRRLACRQLLGVQAGAGAILAPARLAPAGLAVRSVEGSRLLCRHADATTAALSWARLPSECPEEEARRESRRQRRAAIAACSARLFTEALLRAGVADATKLAGAVQSGLLRSRASWEERVDSMARALGASADALVSIDEQPARPEFRPVRSKSPEPEWLRALPCAARERRTIRRLMRAAVGTRALRGTRERALRASLAAARARDEQELHAGLLRRSRRVERAKAQAAKNYQDQLRAQQKLEQSRLEQSGLRPAKRPGRPREPGAERDVKGACARGDWRALFGEKLPHEQPQQARRRWGRRLLQLRARCPECAEELVSMQHLALSSLTRARGP
jgi:hypothetical protein